jgi:hypothetical protein
MEFSSGGLRLVVVVLVGAVVCYRLNVSRSVGPSRALAELFVLGGAAWTLTSFLL